MVLYAKLKYYTVARSRHSNYMYFKWTEGQYLSSHHSENFELWSLNLHNSPCLVNNKKHSTPISLKTARPSIRSLWTANPARIWAQCSLLFTLVWKGAKYFLNVCSSISLIIAKTFINVICQFQRIPYKNSTDETPCRAPVYRQVDRESSRPKPKSCCPKF